MPIRIRIAGYQDEPSVHTRAVRVMIRALSERAGAGVAVEFERNIVDLGRPVVDLLALVESGALDLCYFSSSYLAVRVPALGALDIPFRSSERGETQATLRGDLGAVIRREVAERTGYIVLAFWDNGLRNLSNSKRPVLTPADCAGLRIRTLPSEGYHATFRALGMTPVTIDVADMVRAIAAGEVDAQENPLTNIRLFGLQRYHRFVTMTRHFHGIALLLCNASAWARWPEAARAPLGAAVVEATAAQWRFAADDEDASHASLVGEGVAIVEPDAETRTAFRHAVRDVVERQLAILPLDVARLI